MPHSFRISMHPTSPLAAAISSRTHINRWEHLDRPYHAPLCSAEFPLPSLKLTSTPKEMHARRSPSSPNRAQSRKKSQASSIVGADMFQSQCVSYSARSQCADCTVSARDDAYAYDDFVCCFVKNKSPLYSGGCCLSIQYTVHVTTVLCNSTVASAQEQNQDREISTAYFHQ